MSNTSWLHLSDLHFSIVHSLDESIVVNALLSDIKEQLTGKDSMPDFVVVTVDIAFSGKAKEHEIAKNFFIRLLEILHLDKDRLFLVPGNHDFNRSIVTEEALAR